jgi:hypothetical protein
MDTIMDTIWNNLPADVLHVEIIPKMDPETITDLFRQSLDDACMCKRVLLPASKFFTYDCPALGEYVALAALKHIPTRKEFDDFFKTGYAFPMLCSLSKINGDYFLKCVLQRGDVGILLAAVDGCTGCISYAFDYLTDYGHVDEFRSMAWNFGLNMKTVFQALYNGNRVIMQEVHKCLAISPSTFVSSLVENLRYYKNYAETEYYDGIPYILDLSYQLLDAKKRRWLGKQLRLLAKALKTKWLISFVRDFYHLVHFNDEREDVDHEVDDY